MKTLNLSKDGTGIPVEFLSLRAVTYGGSGAGKTALGRVIFEESVRAGICPGVIDLKADWWGLKSSADGHADGIPVIVFGGDHADLPIHENGGAELAELVAELRQPFIIDLEHFSKGKQLKFLAPFFDRLYDKNRHPLKLICDEADRYIPQRLFSGIKDANPALCLGAGEDIAKRGRKHGIFPMFISQRNADLNKSVTELCDVAIVFRTSGPNDQKAVNDWFNAKGSLITFEQQQQVMEEIAALPTGTAYFCSAHPHLNLFRKIAVRLPETFDSSATPEIGRELLQPKKFARIELDQLGERMKTTIANAKANDPAELKRQVIALEKLLADRPAPTNTEVPILQLDEAKKLDALISKAENLILSVQEEIGALTARLEGLHGELVPFRDALNKAVSQASHHRVSNAGMEISKHRAPMRFALEPSDRIKIVADNNPSLPPGEKLILNCLIWYTAGLKREQLTVMTGYKKSSRDAYIQRLREKKLVDTDGYKVFATEAGHQALPDVVPLPNGKALQDFWKNKLPQGEWAVLELLIHDYPKDVDREQISTITGFKKSSRDAYIQRLRAKELVDEIRRGFVRASETLF